MDRSSNELTAGVHPAGEGEAEEDGEHQEEDGTPAVLDHEPDLFQEFGAEEQGKREDPRSAAPKFLHSVAFHSGKYKQEDYYRLQYFK